MTANVCAGLIAGTVAIAGVIEAAWALAASKVAPLIPVAVRAGLAADDGDVGGAEMKPLGLGSTAKSGVSRVNPMNLTEELAMQEIKSNPSMGNFAKLKKGMTDSRWHQDNGWRKMSWNNGGVEIHYVGQWQNGVLKAVDDFKIIGK